MPAMPAPAAPIPATSSRPSSRALVLAQPPPTGHFGTEASAVINTAEAAYWNFHILAWWCEYAGAPYVSPERLCRHLKACRVLRDAYLQWAAQDLIHVTYKRG